MALVKDTLLANEALKGLSDEQISAIETLSKNDEDAVIGGRFSEVYRQMDSTIEKATGIKRNGDEKTYNYLERAAKEFAGKYADYDSLKTKVGELEQKIATGGDAALKAQLDSVKGELEAAKGEYATLKATYEKEKGDNAKALLNFKIDSEIARAKDGLKFKAGLNEAVMTTLVSQAIANIKAKNPSFEDRGGVQTLVFRDAEGKPLLNAENKLNPYTAKELLTKEFEKMDILEKSPAKGAGGEPPKPSATISGATTRIEALTAIEKMLSERGISKTSLDYQREYDKLCEEYKVSDLPDTK